MGLAEGIKLHKTQSVKLLHTPQKSCFIRQFCEM